MSRNASRIALLASTVATSAAATCIVFWPLGTSTVPVLDAVVMAMFFVLTAWVVFWFALSTIGFWKVWHRAQRGGGRARDEQDLGPFPSTAILLPIYNEQPGPVFARVRAMMESLEETGHSRDFDFFILSDSTEPDVWLEEELKWLYLRQELNRPSSVYYRRRNANTGRKAGNISDFCKRWGAGYRYMVVIDADSLMDGQALVELARRMEADPALGILQTAPLPLGDDSLISRYQQFAAKLCGPLIAEGLNWFADDGGNYWGHNAIIRTAAFTRHCGLSALPGKPPLGGEILSHDFVEAALMQRAGFKVRMATDITQSYEQAPTTLPDIAQRDQRWCQGNLQHGRLVISQRIPILNRFHFATGVMAYAASPMWLTFLVLGPLAMFLDRSRLPDFSASDGGPTVGLFAFVLVMLLLTAPFFEGLLLVLKKRSESKGFGGVGRLALSTLGVLAISVLIAPIMMAFHTLFVVTTLLGRCVGWDTQNRDGTGVTLRQAWRIHWWQTAAGLIVALFTWLYFAQALPWLLPVLTGLVLAVPLSTALSSPTVGRWFKRQGVLQVPEEHCWPPVVRRFRQKLDEEQQHKRLERTKLFRQVLRDPTWLRFHIAALAETASERNAPPEVVERVEARLAAERTQDIAFEDKKAVLCDPDALKRLHQLLWMARAARSVVTD
jgi:membrane glycosyltransferase